MFKKRPHSPTVLARIPLAYADRFALALAHLRDATVVTEDREFQKAEGVVSLEWVGRGMQHG
ncbi:MAG: hypothetical protein M1358_25505 [Chloroflexi bacterium]|nr:hypothetical protein [Chloroflexota bacterium]